MNLDKIRRRDLQLIAYHEAGHLIYLLTAPVAVSDVARIQPVLFMAAIQEGLRRALEADRGYAGVVVKNPAHKHWQTHTWRAEPYLLEELAAEGKSLREIGEALGVSFKTVGNWLKSAGV